MLASREKASVVGRATPVLVPSFPWTAIRCFREQLRVGGFSGTRRHRSSTRDPYPPVWKSVGRMHSRWIIGILSQHSKHSPYVSALCSFEYYDRSGVVDCQVLISPLLRRLLWVNSTRMISVSFLIAINFCSAISTLQS